MIFQRLITNQSFFFVLGPDWLGVNIVSPTVCESCQNCCFLVPKIFVSADDELNLVSTNTVESEYVYDTLFYIPEYDFTMLGQTEKSKATLISPSNKAYDATKVKLNETGYWTLKFTPFNSVFEIGFTVYKPTYEVTSDKGSVTYGETNFYSKNETGLFVNIPKKSVFMYNDVINLTGLNKSQNVLEFGIVPNSIGVSDVGRVFVYLTDIYDPSNYIVYRIHFRLYLLV